MYVNAVRACSSSTTVASLLEHDLQVPYDLTELVWLFSYSTAELTVRHHPSQKDQLGAKAPRERKLCSYASHHLRLAGGVWGLGRFVVKSVFLIQPLPTVLAWLLEFTAVHESKEVWELSSAPSAELSFLPLALTKKQSRLVCGRLVSHLLGHLQQLATAVPGMQSSPIQITGDLFTFLVKKSSQCPCFFNSCMRNP